MSILLAASVTLCGGSLAHAQDEAFFTSKVRPILEANCYECHGAEKIKGGLTIISRAALVEGGEQGPAIDVDHPGESLLLEMISYKDYNHQMPPDGKLGVETVATLTKWIEAGAPWPEDAEFEVTAERESDSSQGRIWEQGKSHWAYQPLKRPDVPKVDDAVWNANPIDAFVRDGLDARGFTPADEAERGALIRRAYYDLIGLPPTPTEVRAFVNAKSDDAWEAVIDYLLASPQYGEKWGRHWLDAVRYADSNGYERDTDKPYMWRYRDYVIDSFNTDKPYSQFIREQIAGDELDDVTAETIVATGYNRLSIWNDEPDDPLLARYDYLDDIANTSAQVMLGMTMGCARCHDHKIDPILQSDYYSFVSFFDNIELPKRGDQKITRSILTPFEQQVYEERVREKDQRVNALVRDKAAFEKRVRKRMPEASGVSDLVELEYRFYRDTWKELPDFDMLRPENAGNVANNYITTSVATRDKAMGIVFEGKLNVPADGEYTFHVRSRDGVRLRVGDGVIIDQPKLGDSKAEGKLALKTGLVPFRIDYFNRAGKPELNVVWSGADFKMRPLSADGSAADAVDFDTLIANLGDEVFEPGERDEYNTLKSDIDKAKKEPVPGKWAAAVAERGNEPPQAHVLIRGNPHVEGDEVAPAFPSVLNPPAPAVVAPTEDSRTTGRRRVLADWIASDDNPMTARVMANRVWQHHFGRGIVRSSNDFGLQGVKPTHPELLNWLAAELVAVDWRLKPLHKKIMISRTYRMASTVNEEALAKDPTNESFWRFNMRRLTAEEVRDSVLNVSGDLDLAMGGPGIYPTLPEAVLSTSSMAHAIWFESPKEKQGRRSIYVHVKRSMLVPTLTDFDFADTDSSCPVRFSTVQPTQALNTLNSRFFNEQASRFAERLRLEAGSDRADQARLALNLATSRKPTFKEIRQSLALMDELEAGGTPKNRVLDRFTLLVLNLNEMMYLD